MEDYETYEIQVQNSGVWGSVLPGRTNLPIAIELAKRAEQRGSTVRIVVEATGVVVWPE